MRLFKALRKDGIEVLYRAYRFPNIPKINVSRETFLTFDIETTTYEVDGTYSGFMYIWAICIDGICIYGRFWSEFISCIKYITMLMDKVIIYVHNLGYEFQFMYQFLEEEFGELDIFAVKSRTPLVVRCNDGSIEFRCSYKLTNMSLAKACENEYGCVYLKRVGDLDYSVYRTPYTHLDDDEFSYSISDVLCQWHMIYHKMRNEGDNLNSIPLTSTGYVRRDCRKNCKSDKSYMSWYNKNALNKNVYKLLKEAGRGGDTSANCRLVGTVLENVKSFDVLSSYPYQLLCKKFPSRKFRKMTMRLSEESLNDCISQGKACLFRVTFNRLTAKPDTVDLYLSYSKNQGCSGNKSIINGRVAYAEAIAFTLTDIDWLIVDDTYTWDSCDITSLYTSKYDYLPKALWDSIYDYFKRKCLLSFEKDTEQGGYIYAKSKNKLNGIFGMCYTDPVHAVIEFINNEWVCKEGDMSSLSKTSGYGNNFLVYAVGVWTTAHARNHLHKLIKFTGDGTIYWDTDSSKAVGVNIDLINQANQEIINECIERGAYYEVNGKTFYLGIYEDETENGAYREFKTLGAKKYCYRDYNGYLHLTVSGVKKQGVKELHKDIDNFHVGYEFKDAGGSVLYYHYAPIHKMCDTDGTSTFLTASGIGITPRTYKIGAEKIYKKIIDFNIDTVL